MESKDRFIQLKAFPLIVPNTYQHATQLISFRRKHHGRFYFYHGDITDGNFSLASAQLIPGKTYLVRFFEIVSPKEPSEACMEFLHLQKTILVNAQGLSFVWEQSRREFPQGKSVWSFDRKGSLFVVKDGFPDDDDRDGDHMVPRICRSSDGLTWGFGLSRFEADLQHNCCLLSVQDAANE